MYKRQTKIYALDADATEDPTVHRIPETGGDDSFEAAPEDMLDGDIDGHVTLKPGEAPEQVSHPLTPEARLKAVAFTWLKTSKFVRDMISVGVLPITSDLQRFEKLPAGMFVKQRTAKQLEELCKVRRLASKLPTPSKDMLDEQRAAFQAVETHRVDTAETVSYTHLTLPTTTSV